MRWWKKTGLAAVAITGVSLFGLMSAEAVVYSYIGNDFTFVGGVYTTSDKVTVSVTLSTALGANFSGQVVPTSFTFFDGLQTITQASLGNPLSLAGFYFRTDATGSIIGWDDFALVHTLSAGDSQIATIHNVPGLLTNTDIGEWPDILGSGSNLANPGTWTLATSTSETPLPPALVLLASGLGLVGLLSRRRKPMHAAVIEV